MEALEKLKGTTATLLFHAETEVINSYNIQQG
jgi:hypothetical protein